MGKTQSNQTAPEQKGKGLVKVVTAQRTTRKVMKHGGPKVGGRVEIAPTGHRVNTPQLRNS